MKYLVYLLLLFVVLFMVGCSNVDLDNRFDPKFVHVDLNADGREDLIQLEALDEDDAGWPPEYYELRTSVSSKVHGMWGNDWEYVEKSQKFPSTYEIISVRVEDVNKDGKKDLLLKMSAKKTGNNYQEEVSYGDGKGNFTSPKFYRAY